MHKYNDGTVELRAVTNWDFCLGHDGIAPDALQQRHLPELVLTLPCDRDQLLCRLG
ncbi:hypothetical protein [Streptomyces griseoluteus]|uniref:hypothetical protein n=1 Tax=Streptomyces griseoluteus TaxID=29306 RepID=UPI0036FB7DBC